MSISLGWSDFAIKRHHKKGGNSYSTFPHDVVVELVKKHWDARYPGQGETGLDRKVVVPVPPASFRCASVLITDAMREAPISVLRANVTRRAPGEDLFVGNSIRRIWAWLQGVEVQPEAANHATVVCYSAEALLENNGQRSTECDWEIVCIIASPVEKEPMPHLTMARNMLVKTGGTKSTYSAEEFAESVYYWSQRVRL